MCMNKKIRSELNFLAKKPGGLVVDELNCGRPEVLNKLLTLIGERPMLPKVNVGKPGLTTQTRWNLIKDRIEREYETNQG